jgi:hypothetical protein
MPTILSFVFRLFLLAAGLVFAASLAVVFAVVLALWLLRAGWARLTGRPVTPFVMRMHPRNGFAMYRRAGEGSRTPRADAAPMGRINDVTDVEPKQRS